LIDNVIRDKYNLPVHISPEVKKADYEAVLTERRDVVPEPRGVDWGVAKAEPWPERIIPWDASTARFMFLRRFKELT